MKKLLLFIFLSSLIGCGNNKNVKLIESFVCTTDGITSDLNFKMIDLTEISPIRALDSMMLYLVSEEMPLKYSRTGDSVSFTYKDQDGIIKNETGAISEIDTSIAFWFKIRTKSEAELNKAKDNLSKVIWDLNNSSAYTSVMTDLYESSIKSNEEIVTMANNIIDTLVLAKKYSKISPETILLRAFDCTYTIFNPILKVKQTQTQTFYFNSELTKVVCSSGIKK